MLFAYDKKILIFLLISIGLIVLPHGFHLPLTVFSFFILLLSWRFLAIWRPDGLPKGWVLAVLAACGVAILFKQFHTLLGRDAGTSLFLIALGLKLMEIKTERELYLVTYLAFIVAASQFLYEQSILMAAYILFVSCVLLASLVYINSVVARTSVALKTSGLIIAQAIPLAIVVFIFFPRVDPPRWLLFNDKQEARMGLSDSMEPGSITDLGMSEELVFRVKFAGDLPPPQERYWRGPVLSFTDGKKWLPSNSAGYQQYQDKVTFSGTAYHYTLMMEPQNKNWVFALDLPAQVPNGLSQNANYQIISEVELDKRSEFKLTSYPSFNTGYLNRYEYQTALQLPGEPSESINNLIKQLHGFDSAPEVFIQNFLTHFRQEDFHYTLTPPLMEDNPIETFLFETRRGFCSHYAAAFVYVLRAANIPARVVTGYQGGVLNQVGNFLEVRQADAHAWTEVWLDKKGWVRFDPTAAIAPERVERELDISRLVQGEPVRFASPFTGNKAALDWLKSAQQLWGHVDYSWQRWVINYNHGNQANFLALFGIVDFKTMVFWMMGVVGIFTSILSLILLYRRPKANDRAVLIYTKFLKKIAKTGYEKRPGEGARTFAERIKPRLPVLATSIDAITAEFMAQRYGRKPTAAGLKNLQDLIKALKP